MGSASRARGTRPTRRVAPSPGLVGPREDGSLFTRAKRSGSGPSGTWTRGRTYWSTSRKRPLTTSRWCGTSASRSRSALGRTRCSPANPTSVRWNGSDSPSCSEPTTRCSTLPRSGGRWSSPTSPLAFVGDRSRQRSSPGRRSLSHGSGSGSRRPLWSRRECPARRSSFACPRTTRPIRSSRGPPNTLSSGSDPGPDSEPRDDEERRAVRAATPSGRPLADRRDLRGRAGALRLRSPRRGAQTEDRGGLDGLVRWSVARLLRDRPRGDPSRGGRAGVRPPRELHRPRGDVRDLPQRLPCGHGPREGPARGGGRADARGDRGDRPGAGREVSELRGDDPERPPAVQPDVRARLRSVRARTGLPATRDGAEQLPLLPPDVGRRSPRPAARDRDLRKGVPERNRAPPGPVPDADVHAG